MHQLEDALHSAIANIERKTESEGWWEGKAGELQQQLGELESVRRALTLQLHTMREDVGPKEKKLLHTMDRLNEVKYILYIQIVFISYIISYVCIFYIIRIGYDNSKII